MNWCVFSKAFDLPRKQARAALLGLSLGLATTAQAAQPDEVYQKIVSTVVKPGFSQLASQARHHAEHWATLCADGATVSNADVAASFHDLADAWAAVEMFRSGPAATDFRRDRFYLWPERKNAVARALAAALSTPADVAMTDAWMNQQSAAIQGLPVLERLLFGADDTITLPKPGTTECRLGVAASRSASRIAAAMAEEWTRRTAAPDQADRTALATDIITGITLAKDEKLEAVIGQNETQVKPKSAEFWRSRRSLRNLVLNLETYVAVAAIVSPKLEAPVMPYAAETVSKVVATMHEPLADYGKGQLRSEAYFLKAALDSLGNSAAAEVSGALGVTVGFNSSDGD